MERARKNGVRFGWVGADSLYGHNNKFLNTLEDRGEKFMADVRKSFTIWTEEPVLSVGGQRGRTPVRKKLDPDRNKARHLKIENFVTETFDKNRKVIIHL